SSGRAGVVRGVADADGDRPVSAFVGREPVLFLTHRVPFPPDKGDRIRTFHVLRHLSRQGPVDLACLADEPPAPGTHEALAGLCRRVAVVAHGSPTRWVRAARSVLAGGSLSEGFFWSAELSRLLRSWAATTRYAG